MAKAKILSTISGGIYATIDCLTTGDPLLTIAAPIWGTMKVIMSNHYAKQIHYEDIVDYSLTDHIQNLGSYALGAAIPFGIKYHNEIIEFAKKIF
ncbi:MAG: hypothetical protein KJ847_04210 [Firmicutes bacterium]|nr:hypothetical protein [Bacillota bacterium]